MRPRPADQVDAVDLLLAQLGVGGRLGRLGVDLLRQGVGGRGHVALGRILAQQPAHHVDAAGELALRFEEAGHAALAQEAALDRRAEDQVAPLVLAHLVIGRADLDDLGEGDLLGRPLLLDDLEVADHLGRRAKLQVDVQEHLHRLLVDVRRRGSTSSTSSVRCSPAVFRSPLSKQRLPSSKSSCGVSRYGSALFAPSGSTASGFGVGDGQLLGPIGVADHRRAGAVLARQVAVQLVVDRADVAAVADVERDRARARSRTARTRRGPTSRSPSRRWGSAR